jgi:hypothetical protein
MFSSLAGPGCFYFFSFLPFFFSLFFLSALSLFPCGSYTTYTMRNTKILSGSSHLELAQMVAKKLGTPLADTTSKKFSNKETR